MIQIGNYEIIFGLTWKENSFENYVFRIGVTNWPLRIMVAHAQSMLKLHWYHYLDKGSTVLDRLNKKLLYNLEIILLV